MDPKEFHKPPVFEGDFNGSMDFDNPKVYGDTSTFGGLVDEHIVLYYDHYHLW